MELTVKKWGNSIGIIIPNTFAKPFNLDVGSKLELTQEHDGIKLVPKPKNRKEQLDLLLSQITPENIHHEDFFAKEVGKEIW